MNGKGLEMDGPYVCSTKLEFMSVKVFKKCGYEIQLTGRAKPMAEHRLYDRLLALQYE